MTLADVRVNIDRVDGEIKKLFVERMQLADQVAQIKAKTEDVIYKPDREVLIIEKQSQDMDDALVMEYKALIKRVMEISRKYQYGRTLELRDCFPYSYETSQAGYEKTAMVKSELYICDMYPKDSITTVSDFKELGELIESGKADSGIGIIEHIGSGVSDSLNTLLLRGHYYINRCKVVNDGGNKVKVAGFSKKLVVMEHHNRLKVVFVCPNRSGALASILSMIADYGVNLTELHSIPYKEGDNWNYRFFLELNMNLLSRESKALIYQLSQETSFFQILGSYHCEGDFVE